MVKHKWQPDKAFHMSMGVFCNGLPAYYLDTIIAPMAGPASTDDANNPTEEETRKQTKAKKTTKKTTTSKLFF